jgi:hypothetical protein
LARLLQFFDLLEAVQPHLPTTVPHHLPVLKPFRQFIMIEVWRRGLPNGVFSQRSGGTVITAHLLFDGLPQILYQVETVRYLPRLRRALPGRLGIKAASVSTDNFDSGMFAKPSGHRLGGTIMQHVDDLPTLKIHNDGPVPGSLQPTPVIDANHAERLGRRSRNGA